MEFDELGFREEILQGIYSYGFEKPSPIQEKAIPGLISGRDMVAQAQSGTGKTATFSLGALQRCSKDVSATQAMIISPTRELADQTFDVISALGQYSSLRLHRSVGGTVVRQEITALETQAPHVIVGTPGRIIQMVERRSMDLSQLRIFVIDEADEMLKQGFRDQLIRLFAFIPPKTQVAIFSATMPEEAKEISKRFMNDPIHILIQDEQLTLEGIRQYYINVYQEDYKFDTLYDLYKKLSVSQTIIFCNSKKKVNTLTEQLRARNFTVSALHSDMDHGERTSVYKEFKMGRTRILVTTDILARGIDIQSISFVINYDLPRNKECYIHRIGRSGRYGKKGVAINFATEEDIRDVKALEHFYHTQISEMPVEFDKHLSP